MRRGLRRYGRVGRQLVKEAFDGLCDSVTDCKDKRKYVNKDGARKRLGVSARDEAADRKRSSGESSARGAMGVSGSLILTAGAVRTWYRLCHLDLFNLLDLLNLLSLLRLLRLDNRLRVVPLLLLFLKRPLCILRRHALVLNLPLGPSLLDLVPQSLEIICECAVGRQKQPNQQASVSESRSKRAPRTVKHESGRLMLEEDEGLRAALKLVSASRGVARQAEQRTRAMRSRTASGESIRASVAGERASE